MQKRDIVAIEDIKLMVDSFYGKIQEDAILSFIFNDRIRDRWSEHLEKMYKFWQTVLLDEHTYFGAPFPPHATLDINHTHYERWVQLFNETIDHLFIGDKAQEAKWRGQKMAQVFLARTANYKIQITAE
jgi:hemoglobin